MQLTNCLPASLSLSFLDPFFPNRKAKYASLGVVALLVLRKVLKMRKKAAYRKEVARQKPGVAYLYGFPRSDKSPTMSSPVLQVETFLRIARIPYIYNGSCDPELSPTGHLPYIAYNGELIPEAGFIIRQLLSKAKLTTDDRLSPADHVRGTLVRRVCENSIRLHQLRYVSVDNVTFMAKRYARVTGYPVFFMGFILKSLRKKTLQMLNLHGHGDLSQAEYLEEFDKDIVALESLLTAGGAKFGPFLFGDKPTSYDACLYAYCKNALVLVNELPCAAFKRVAEGPLATYVAAMDKLAFPDLETICKDRKAANQDFTKLA